MIRHLDGRIPTRERMARYRRLQAHLAEQVVWPKKRRPRVLAFPVQSAAARPLCAGGCGRIVSTSGAVCLPCARDAA